MTAQEPTHRNVAHSPEGTSSRAGLPASARERRTPPQQAFYPPGQDAEQDRKRYDDDEIDLPAFGEGKRQRKPERKQERVEEVQLQA